MAPASQGHVELSQVPKGMTKGPLRRRGPLISEEAELLAQGSRQGLA